MRSLSAVFIFVLHLFSSSYVLAGEYKADYVLVDKAERKLYLQVNGKIVKEYRVAFGANPKGHKLQEGDERTPEGKYTLDYKKGNSSFYKAIHISYPNTQDSIRAKTAGVNPGGVIMIHGQPNGFGWLAWILQFFNWTDGCIAVTNAEMEEIWQMVDAGTPVEIRP